MCLSFAGFKSHVPKHVQSATPHHNIQVCQSDRQCPVCGKICCNLADLESHLRVHTTQRKIEKEREREREREREQSQNSIGGHTRN